MSSRNVQAVRAFNKLLSITTEGWDEMEGCDRHYDGGEWSGPAWAKNWENEYDRVGKLVSGRFGIPEETLANAYYFYEFGGGTS